MVFKHIGNGFERFLFFYKKRRGKIYLYVLDILREPLGVEGRVIFTPNLSDLGN